MLGKTWLARIRRSGTAQRPGGFNVVVLLDGQSGGAREPCEHRDAIDGGWPRSR